MEKILSNHFDFVHFSCFEGKAKDTSHKPLTEISILSLDHVRVERYDEREERPEHIHEADVFYRSDFDVMKSKVQVSD